MIKSVVLTIATLLLFSCQSDRKKQNDNSDRVSVDTTTILPDEPQLEKFDNDTFKEVTVSKINDTTFTINGKARVFEAQFGWDIEDGHDVLKSGFVKADAGAPEFGTFSFRVSAQKTQPNSTLHLVLFENSPKDGSRQHELPIKLY